MIELLWVKLKRLAHNVGVDRAVFFTVLARGWGVVAGILTIVFVTRFLSPELQGYYYTFYSLIALQIFVELGLNFAIIQFASHEMAKLTWTAEGTVTGNAQSKRRLQSLIHFALIWFGVAALLMIAVLLPLGIYFFGTAARESTSVADTAGPWSFLVIFAAANLAITAAVAVLEGCGKVVQVAIMRLWQSIFSVSAVWIVLSLGGHLYALAANSFMVALVGLTWLWFKYRIFFKDLFNHRTPLPGMNWRREIWPFQWRIAISWMSGYLVFQIFNPLLFATHGPVVAGQMGMSMQIFSALNGGAMAWITTKIPTYGQLIAKGQRNELDALFFRGLAQSFGLLLVSVIFLGFAIWYLTVTGSTYPQRLLEPSLVAMLAIACLGNQIVFAEACYLRAHKEEPFMLLSLLNGIVTALLAIFFIPTYGAIGAVGSYVTTALLIGLGYGTVIFIRKRKEWRFELSNSIGIKLCK
jgi:O-antigen/teichoic acid export membrane protein